MPISNLLIDFDHTIFNSSQIKYEWANTLEQCGVPKDIFWRTYPLARYGEEGRPVYNPKVHVELLKDYLIVTKEEALQRIEEVNRRSREFLFADAVPFLNRMLSLNVPMTLILHGEKEYQKDKVEGSAIADFFKRVHYSDKSRQQIINELEIDPNQKTFWISHNLSDMVKVKEKYPFINPVIKRRADIPLVHYRETGFLNFENFNDMQDYLTIIHATSY